MTEQFAGETSGVDTHLILNALNSMAASHAKQGLPENETLFALSDYVSAILPHARTLPLPLGEQLKVMQLQLTLYAQVSGLALRQSIRCTAGLAQQKLAFDLGAPLTALLGLLQPKQGGAWNLDMDASLVTGSGAVTALEMHIVLRALSAGGRLPLEAAKTVLASYGVQGALLSAHVMQSSDTPASYNIKLKLNPLTTIV